MNVVAVRIRRGPYSPWMIIKSIVAATGCAALGAAAAFLYMRRLLLRQRLRLQQQPPTTTTNASSAFLCGLCRVQCRGAASLRQHLAGEKHRRNAALLSDTVCTPCVRGVQGNSNRPSASVHCAVCDAWFTDIASHHSSRTHMLALRTNAAGTGSRAFFNTGSATAQDIDSGASIGVITCDLECDTNAGAICRVLANFAAVGARLVHVHNPPAGAGSGESGGGRALLVSGRTRSVSRGTDQKLERRLLSVESFASEALPTWDRPIVVLETAAGAVSLCDFAFPSACDILVGGESKGVDARILAALRPGVDQIVFIPMQAGCHRSMNVAAAVTVALYEYRKQHPG